MKNKLTTLFAMAPFAVIGAFSVVKSLTLLAV
jgi:hypothetical protein